MRRKWAEHKALLPEVPYMRAGAKFPSVLEKRLAECKVMLVLIGPEWLNARNEQGGRRLETPDDWVRLEIGHALRRDITVIPVLVNGGKLPDRMALPDDIQGLLDHQAMSVSVTGFRHEMSGLVRDIRSISSRWPLRRFGAVAGGLLLLLLTVLVLGQASGRNALERIWLTRRKGTIWPTSGVMSVKSSSHLGGIGSRSARKARSGMMRRSSASASITLKIITFSAKLVDHAADDRIWFFG